MTAAVELSPALADLFSRAGASDQDRDLWLAERRTGLTATEVRDLILKGPSFRRELIERKLGRRAEVDDLSHVPEIGWGKAREAAIAAEAQRRFNIAPESRVFHAADDSRFLFSPDGVGVDWEDTLLISELKTDGQDIAPWTDRFDSKGYLFQMTWGMRVSGARKCLYGWEIREGSRQDGFRPGELRFDWIHYDEKLAATLEQVALEFLAELDAARENDADPAIDDALDVLAVNYLRFLDMENEGKAAKEGVWAQLKALLADVPTLSQESALARVTWTRGGPVTSEKTTEVESVDEEAAKLSAGHVFAKLHAARTKLAAVEREWAEVLAAHTTTEKVTETVTTNKRDNLRVTAVKQKEMAA